MLETFRANVPDFGASFRRPCFEFELGFFCIAVHLSGGSTPSGSLPLSVAGIIRSPILLDREVVWNPIQIYGMPRLFFQPRKCLK